jgi:hypothetical protein
LLGLPKKKEEEMQLGMITEIVWREFERQQKEDWKRMSRAAKPVIVGALPVRGQIWCLVRSRH